MIQHVRCEQTYPTPAALLWRLVRDFYDDWHPAMRWCEAEPEQIRRFAMVGDDSIYREQLIYYSDEERTYRYVMLEGIPVIESYEASVQVQATADNECTILWQAKIAAPDRFVERIAKGTEAIFTQGLQTLEAIITDRLTTKTVMIESSPRLALDVMGEGELCLFLHGIGGNRTNWQAQLLALAPHYRTAALDLRGYGQSELGDETLTVDVVVSDILRVLDHFQVEKVHLIGLSLGSWLAACFTQLQPERVVSLTLCAGSTGMSEAGPGERARFKESRFAPIQAGATPADIAEAVVEAISGPNSTAVTRSILWQSMQTLSRDAYLQALNCFLNPPFKLNFESFTCPTLLIAGEHDKLAPPQRMREIAQRIPKSQFVEIVGAGHLINIEAEASFNQALEAFLTS